MVYSLPAVDFSTGPRPRKTVAVLPAGIPQVSTAERQPRAVHSQKRSHEIINEEDSQQGSPGVIGDLAV